MSHQNKTKVLYGETRPLYLLGALFTGFGKPSPWEKILTNCRSFQTWLHDLYKKQKSKNKKKSKTKKTLLRWRMWWHTSIRFSIQELPQGTFILKSKDSTILERNWFSSGLAGLESCVIFNLHVNVTVWGEGLRERSRRASYIFSFWQFLPYYISSPLSLKNVLFDKAYSS